MQVPSILTAEQAPGVSRLPPHGDQVRDQRILIEGVLFKLYPKYIESNVIVDP